MQTSNVPTVIGLIVVFAASATLALIVCLFLPLAIIYEKGNETIDTSERPVIETRNGNVSGSVRISREGRVFEGWTKIPYAKPPIGPLRFQPPEPAGKWKDTLDATINPPACMQKPFKQYGLDTVISEDCLYLNVYRPKVRPPFYLPVLVYIHGGAFEHGTVGGRQNADYLMDENVVLVEINYRLNGFGFMSLNDDVFPGNYGMKDLVLSLKWIKANIEAFSGNPNSITIFGESAGAGCAHLLMKSPSSRDLVTRAVSHSGSINPTWSSTPGYFMRGPTLETAKVAGCNMNGSEAILLCLQNLTATELLAAISNASRMPLNMDFNPIVEPKTAKDAFAVEDLALVPSNKPWMNTLTNGEYNVFSQMFAGDKKRIVKAYYKFPALLENVVLDQVKNSTEKLAGAAILRQIYFPERYSIDNFTMQLAKMYADNYFVFPSIFNIVNHHGPVWVSYLEYTPTVEAKPNEGSSHAANIFFYFNRTSEYPETTTPEFIAASKRMIKYLVNFAYYSNPNSLSSPNNWPQFKTHEILRVKRSAEFVSDQLTFDYFQMLKNMWLLIKGWN